MSSDGSAALLRRVQRALADLPLRRSVAFTTERLRLQRQAALAALPDSAGLRARGRAARRQVIEALDQYLAQAVERVHARGGQVHFCRDAGEAAAVVLEIARRRGARLIAKSKSMASEEIHLNQQLAAAGLEVVETDLGEWIVQLAGDTPSHIIIPAIHKTRQQVAELFSQVVGGQPVPTDTPSLTRIARETLRRVFFVADIGISGGNFLVAETGSVVLVTNEGNDRMLTSLCPVHVAIVGMERVVADWSDLSVLLSLLARSATGQKLTAYTSVLTGPRQPGELDGPEEFHLIILDNGRSAIARSRYREILHCIRCGACLNVCPVYRQIGGHAYGSPYSGPIGAVLTPLLLGQEQYGALAQATSLCGACSEVCPVLIPLHDLLVDLRGDAVAAGRRPWLERLAMRLWAYVFSRPRLFALSGRIGYLLQQPLRHGAVLRGGPAPLRAWTRRRDFPALARHSFRERWRQGLSQEGDGV